MEQINNSSKISQASSLRNSQLIVLPFLRSHPPKIHRSNQTFRVKQPDNSIRFSRTKQKYYKEMINQSQKLTMFKRKKQERRSRVRNKISQNLKQSPQPLFELKSSSKHKLQSILKQINVKQYRAKSPHLKVKFYMA